MSGLKLRLPKSIETALGQAVTAIDAFSGLKDAIAHASSDAATARPRVQISTSGISIDFGDDEAPTKPDRKRGTPLLGDGHDGPRHRAEDQALRAPRKRKPAKAKAKRKPVKSAPTTKRKRKKRAAS